MNKSRKERHFFLEKENKRIYCVEYIADPAKDNKQGVILCKPTWGERIRTHRIFTNLARMLREEGFNIISFDYFGDGNSGGDTLDLNFSSMVDDIVEVSKYLSSQYQVEFFTMTGLRIGANCAIGAEPKIKNLKRMILFEPILNPVEDLKVRLRANLSTQMAVHKKIIKNRDLIIKDIKSGIPVNMDGFLIGKSLWESFEKASPLRVDSDFDGSVLILSLIDKGRKGKSYDNLASNYTNGKFKTIEKEFVWYDWKKNVTYPPVFLSTIIDELTSNF